MLHVISLVTVENGSKGDRLLFRYPYEAQTTLNCTKRTRTSKLMKTSIGKQFCYENFFKHVEQLQTSYPSNNAEDMPKANPAYSSNISGSVHSFPNKVFIFHQIFSVNQLYFEELTFIQGFVQPVCSEI